MTTPLTSGTFVQIAVRVMDSAGNVRVFIASGVVT
jgi:hypothetical protein